MDRYKVDVLFTEPLLGTVADGEVFKEHGPTPPDGVVPEDEMETVPEVDVATTGFHEVDGVPVLYDYVVKGFLKDACSMLRRVKGTRSSKLTAHKKVIDGLVFVTPRQIPLVVAGEPYEEVRPLRAQTAKGERIAIARSIALPPETTMSFEISLLGVVSEALLREWFDYGILRGFGQWRNSGMGRFTYKLEAVE